MGFKDDRQDTTTTAALFIQVSTPKIRLQELVASIGQLITCLVAEEPNTLHSKLLPLIVLLVILAIASFIAYQLYLTATQISRTASQKLEQKNVIFSKEGLKVGVKDVKNESYVDATQNFLVKAWNLSTWPEYKSRLWNKQDSKVQGGTGIEKRKSYPATK